MADIGKWLSDTAKDAVGVNEFHKVKQAQDEYNSSKKGTGDYFKAVGKELGYGALGIGKAVVNVGSLLIPEAKAEGAANAVAKGVSKVIGKTPKKIETPFKGGIPSGRQFGPSTGGGKTAVLERPKTVAKPTEAAPKVEAAPKAEAAPKTEAKPKAAESTSTGRGKAFAAGAAAAALAGSGAPKGDERWTPSAIV
jgi:hypothetical protein